MHHSTQENSSVLLEMIQQVTANGEIGTLEADPYERNESRLGYAMAIKIKL